MRVGGSRELGQRLMTHGRLWKWRRTDYYYLRQGIHATGMSRSFNTPYHHAFLGVYPTALRNTDALSDRKLWAPAAFEGPASLKIGRRRCPCCSSTTIMQGFRLPSTILNVARPWHIPSLRYTTLHRHADETSGVTRQVDEELKLPKKSSLVIILLANVLLQVS